MKPQPAFLYALLLLIGLLLRPSAGQSQTCPANIGFEMGNFTNWECFTGKINGDGSLSLALTPPEGNVHTINKSVYPQENDPYGNFPITCPNGSQYSIRLGNNSSGAAAERVSYTFTIPASQNDYSIIYNYAVVFQNPSHADYQQPRFTSKVFDVSSNQYLGCGAFEFVAAAGIDGFQETSPNSNIFYKPWSPITVKLFGLAGKTIRLEFTNNDCSPGGHFGYAYLDVNENCASPISGNTYCNGANEVKLTAPFGFAGYSWFNSDFSTLLGGANVLTISPPPPPGTTYQLVIEPYPGLGCRDTLTTTIINSPDAFLLKVLDSVVGCVGEPLDLTVPAVTAGSTPGLVYSYYQDADGLNYLPSPQYVVDAGIYYIKGVNATGCNELKPIRVVKRPPPTVAVINPLIACFPSTIDLTAASVTAGSEPGLVFSYWKDGLATVPLPNPSALDVTSTYFIKAASAICSIVKSVNVSIEPIPDFTVNNPGGCNSVDLTRPSVAITSDNLNYSYWQDMAATVPIVEPKQITTSGTYYIRAKSEAGCNCNVKPALVTVNVPPSLVIIDPMAVDYPAKIDLSLTFGSVPGVTYTYWKDTMATIPVGSPRRLDTTGTYYIKASTMYGCYTILPVKIKVIPPPEPTILVSNAFSPNNDGINDVLQITVKGYITVKRMTIFDRYGRALYETPNLDKSWKGFWNGQPLPAGVYYWVLEAADVYYKKPIMKNGSIVLLR